MASSVEQRRTKADEVHEVLRAAILSRSILEGERLRQEKVARHWGVSPTPVREAFRRLESEGLVVHEANKGVVVRSPEPPDTNGPLETLAQNWNELVADPKAVLGSDFP